MGKTTAIIVSMIFALGTIIFSKFYFISKEIENLNKNIQNQVQVLNGATQYILKGNKGLAASVAYDMGVREVSVSLREDGDFDIRSVKHGYWDNDFQTRCIGVYSSTSSEIDITKECITNE